MSKAWDNDLLKELEVIFSDSGMYTSLENINGKNVLVVEYSGDNVPEDVNVYVEHLTEDSTELIIMFTIRSGLDEKTSGDILALIPYLNKYLTIGGFGLTESDGYFYYSCSFVIDENTERSLLIKLITATLDVAANTAERAVETTSLLLNGEMSLEQLMNDDYSIIDIYGETDDAETGE